MAESAREGSCHTGTGSGARSLPKQYGVTSWHKHHCLLFSAIFVTMKNRWPILLVALLCFVFLGSPAFVNRSEVVGFVAFAFIFAGIPYTIYKALPKKPLYLILALASPLILGLTWGKWLGFVDNYRLDSNGITTAGIVSYTWTRSTRHGGEEKLFRARFQGISDTFESFSHNNKKNFKVGDSLMIQYLPSDPKTYRIVGLDD